MGKTAFSGPAWGSLSLLWSVSADNIAISTAAQTIAGINVPPGEDWYISRMHVYRGSSGSTNFVCALLDDSTSIANVAITSSGLGVAGSTRLTPTPGEYEGVQVLSGSSLTVTIQNGNSSVVGSSAVKVWIYGYPRWLASTVRTD